MIQGDLFAATTPNQHPSKNYIPTCQKKIPPVLTLVSRDLVFVIFLNMHSFSFAVKICATLGPEFGYMDHCCKHF